VGRATGTGRSGASRFEQKKKNFDFVAMENINYYYFILVNALRFPRPRADNGRHQGQGFCFRDRYIAYTMKEQKHSARKKINARKQRRKAQIQ
jgi:hypothetical protein